jgi:hypothetical protein
LPGSPGCSPEPRLSPWRCSSGSASAAPARSRAWTGAGGRCGWGLRPPCSATAWRSSTSPARSTGSPSPSVRWCWGSVPGPAGAVRTRRTGGPAPCAPSDPACSWPCCRPRSRRARPRWPAAGGARPGGHGAGGGRALLAWRAPLVAGLLVVVPVAVVQALPVVDAGAAVGLPRGGGGARPGRRGVLRASEGPRPGRRQGVARAALGTGRTCLGDGPGARAGVPAADAGSPGGGARRRLPLGPLGTLLA